MVPWVLPFLTSCFSQTSSGMQRAELGSSSQPLLASVCWHVLSPRIHVLNLSVG